MNDRLKKYLVPAILLIIVVVYTILAFLSEGSVGEADDLTHYRYSRYAYKNPYFFLHHWGKPFFTALSSPFAQLGINGIRIFNVLAGTTAAYFTYRMARILRLEQPLLVIFLVISSPLYTVLMLSGMTEILFSLVMILSIFLFYKKHYIWSAILLSFLPFVRTEGVVILPLFFLGLMIMKQWRVLPLLLSGFVFYSILGSFYFDDILWVIHKMPYQGTARDIYGSGNLLHYVTASKFIFGLPLTILVFMGVMVWLVHPYLKQKRDRAAWFVETLVVYMPFFVYLAAHSYVWWRGLGNSVGLIRVIGAIIPSAALLGARGWSGMMQWIPLSKGWKLAVAIVFSLFLITVPYQLYKIPVPLGGTQKLVKEAAFWFTSSGYVDNKFYYYDPYFYHFLKLNPYDKERLRAKVNNHITPEKNIKEGEMVFWDAHFCPNEGQLPLDKLMDNPGYKLVHLVRPEKAFKVLGAYDYEICIFQRIMKDDGKNNHQIYEALLDSISTSRLP